MIPVTANVPSLKVKVRKSFLNPELSGFEDGYLVAVTAICGRPLLFHVHLKTGALFSRLPITALACDKFGPVSINDTNQLKLLYAQPWSCLEGPVEVYILDHLKDSRVQVFGPESNPGGHYLFTVDYSGPGLADDPEQWKSHQVCVLDDGNLVAVPNNQVLFLDRFFTGPVVDWPKYKRQTSYWMAGG